LNLTLKKIREEHCLTQQEIANEVGISKGYYSMIENGKRGLSYATAREIAQALELHPDDIFLDSEFTQGKLKDPI